MPLFELGEFEHVNLERVSLIHFSPKESEPEFYEAPDGAGGTQMVEAPRFAFLHLELTDREPTAFCGLNAERVWRSYRAAMRASRPLYFGSDAE